MMTLLYINANVSHHLPNKVQIKQGFVGDVKGPRKKVNVKKCIFLWNVKDNKANSWFWPFF